MSRFYRRYRNRRARKRPRRVSSKLLLRVFLQKSDSAVSLRKLFRTLYQQLKRRTVQTQVIHQEQVIEFEIKF